LKLNWVQIDTKEGDHSYREEFTAENIPLYDSTSPVRYLYELKGEDVCSVVTGVKFERKYFNWDGVDTITLQRYWCDEESWLRVILEKD